jgi:Fe-S cluster assembly protein SufB
MSTRSPDVQDLIAKKYKHGFVTEIDADTVPPGLNEDIIRLISAKKGEPEFLLEWRLKAYRHWLTMTEPRWAHVHHDPIDYQAISYYSAPKSREDGPKSMDEVDPKLLETYEKLGIPPAWPWTPCLTASQWPPHSRKSSRRRASSSARFRKR